MYDSGIDPIFILSANKIVDNNNDNEKYDEGKWDENDERTHGLSL